MNKFSKILKAYYLYFKDMQKYNELSKDESNFRIDKKNLNKQIFDRFDSAGSIDPHYFLQDIYFAKKIINRNVSKHYDIGSRIDGFISHLLSSQINVTMIDIRPLPYTIDNLNFIEGNATNLNTIKDNSIDSLSSLHAVEHFGLGRYGDPLDPSAWKNALHEYERVISEDGTLYLSTPIGSEDMLCFNAHRIYNPNTIVKQLKNLDLVSFAYIKDRKIYDNFNIDEYCETENYLCGLFEFKKTY